MKIKLFHKIFFKEFHIIFFSTFIVFSLILWGVLFVSNISVLKSFQTTFVYLLKIEFKLFPQVFDLVLPFCWLFSLTSAVSGIHSRNEWIGILGAGVSSNRIRRPYLFFALPLAIFSIFWQEKFVYTLLSERDTLRSESFGISPERKEILLVAGSHENTLYWAVNFNPIGNILEDLIIFKVTHSGKPAFILRARIAEFHDSSLILKSVSFWSYQGGFPKHINYQKLRIQENEKTFIRLLLARDDWGRSSLRDLFHIKQEVENKKLNLPASLQTEIISRLTLSLRFFWMVLWAFLVGIQFRESSFLFNLLTSLCFNLFYYILHLILSYLGNQLILAPYQTGLWEVLILGSCYCLFKRAWLA